MNKQQILDKWKWRSEHDQYLWKNQAQVNYHYIVNNSPRKAIALLEKDYEKYQEMGISIYIKDAINDLVGLKGNKPKKCVSCFELYSMYENERCDNCNRLLPKKESKINV